VLEIDVKRNRIALTLRLSVRCRNPAAREERGGSAKTAERGRPRAEKSDGGAPWPRTGQGRRAAEKSLTQF